MTKRTMQEIADFFGCYVGKSDISGYDDINLFQRKPHFCDNVLGRYYNDASNGKETSAQSIYPFVNDTIERGAMLVEPVALRSKPRTAAEVAKFFDCEAFRERSRKYEYIRLISGGVWVNANGDHIPSDNSPSVTLDDWLVA